VSGSLTVVIVVARTVVSARCETAGTARDQSGDDVRSFDPPVVWRILAVWLWKDATAK
jgi:hypothetical protein